MSRNIPFPIPEEETRIRDELMKLDCRRRMSGDDYFPPPQEDTPSVLAYVFLLTSEYWSDLPGSMLWFITLGSIRDFGEIGLLGALWPALGYYRLKYIVKYQEKVDRYTTLMRELKRVLNSDGESQSRQ